MRTQVSPGGIDVAGLETDDSAPAQAWRVLGPDPREETATQRARRQGLALMVGSSVLMLVLLAAAWLLLRAYF